VFLQADADKELLILIQQARGLNGTVNEPHSKISDDSAVVAAQLVKVHLWQIELAKNSKNIAAAKAIDGHIARKLMTQEEIARDEIDVSQTWVGRRRG